MNKKIELNNDNIGYVESYNFSKANIDYQSRVNVITTIASICWNNPKAIGKEALFTALGDENKGIPSSAYAFVPVLLTDHLLDLYHDELNTDMAYSDALKYGEVITLETGEEALLTNLRAVISDIGEESILFYNTEEECEIIAKHYKVFKVNIDMATSKQFIRHNIHLQELSRRYVNNDKHNFQFYLSKDLKDIDFKRNDLKETNLNEIYEQQIEYYKQAIKQGVKPESARRLIPQAAYTQIWCGFLPSVLENYLDLRLSKKTQLEHRWLAQAIQGLLNE